MGPGSKRSRLWFWIGLSSILVVAGLGVAVEIVIHRAAPILKGRIEETLSTRFNSRVELGDVDVSVLRGLEVTGSDLRIFPPDSVVAAGATDPIIAIRNFSFHAGILGLFIKPMQVGRVYVSGLEIHIPPREMRPASEPKTHQGKMKIDVHEIVCDNSRLVIGTANPGKDPKDFELRHIVLNDVGPNAPWKYDAMLTNAVPRGDIHATGTFGPWQTESAGDSSVTGHYTFDHADLNTIKGIGGMLSSVGNFKGRLNKIAVEGTTETPDFSLDTANRPLPLHTSFRATVDGTTGDTYLERIDAKLRNSSFTTSGEVVNIKGQGHRIDLDVDIPAGRLQDFLDLAVKTKPAVMTATIGMKAKLQISPGKEPVTKKIHMQSNFGLSSVRFTNPDVQEQINKLSLRFQGDPYDAVPGAAEVHSRMNGTFQMNAGALHFSGLSFAFPGARVNLAGVYTLDGQTFDFRGKVHTEAKFSQMVVAKWKRVLLKAVDPFFRSPGGGVEIPVTISGTKSKPKFGVEIFGKSIHN